MCYKLETLARNFDRQVQNNVVSKLRSCLGMIWSHLLKINYIVIKVMVSSIYCDRNHCGKVRAVALNEKFAAHLTKLLFA